ncbi:MAG: hypothetical protein QNJ54_07780 [Prochloraceae cyanobacterium]|nr:hypothetical protein [Prochloraceae cyanobacterium]
MVFGASHGLAFTISNLEKSLLLEGTYKLGGKGDKGGKGRQFIFNFIYLIYPN